MSASRGMRPRPSPSYRGWMTEKKPRINWFAGLIAAIMTSITFSLIWEDWFFGIAIGVMLGVVAAFVFTPSKRP